ncbi:hypothetical protein V2G26_011563 [Clonostachys chloroleuca]
MATLHVHTSGQIAFHELVEQIKSQTVPCWCSSGQIRGVNFLGLLGNVPDNHVSQCLQSLSATSVRSQDPLSKNRYQGKAYHIFTTGGFIQRSISHLLVDLQGLVRA